LIFSTTGRDFTALNAVQKLADHRNRFALFRQLAGVLGDVFGKLLDRFMPRLRRGAEGLLLLAAHGMPVGRGLLDHFPRNYLDGHGRFQDGRVALGAPRRSWDGIPLRDDVDCFVPGLYYQVQIDDCFLSGSNDDRVADGTLEEPETSRESGRDGSRTKLTKAPAGQAQAPTVAATIGRIDKSESSG
jgi:hypothetical protein